MIGLQNIFSDYTAINIGFWRSSYTFAEPQGDAIIVIADEVLIGKENDRLSEQTFRLLVSVNGNTPSNAIEPATFNLDYTLLEPFQNFTLLDFPPEAQTISFDFILLSDTEIENTEAFQARIDTADGFPRFSTGVPLSSSTFIVIECKFLWAMHKNSFLILNTCTLLLLSQDYHGGVTGWLVCNVDSFKLSSLKLVNGDIF